MSVILGRDTYSNKQKMAGDNYRYCLNKDDLVIGLGRKIDPNAGGLELGVETSAYPSVISCMTDGSVWFQKILAAWYNNEANHYNAVMAAAPREAQEDWGKYARVYSCIGVSLGMASAHSSKGDTVCTCMVGGLKSVLNGDFKIQTGDLIMFYWPNERFYFEDNGRRKRTPVGGAANALPGGGWAANVADQAKDKPNDGRTAYHVAKMAKISHGKKDGLFVPLIKPYIVDEGDPENPRDSSRIWARAMSNAQPYEMVDLLIARQAI